MKKIFILLCLFLATGCSVRYNLEINDNEIKEVGTAYFSSTELGTMTLENKLKELVNKYFINDDILIGQETEYINASNNYGYRITNKYDSLEDVSTILYCYDSADVVNNEKMISIETTNSFLCYNYYDELENVTIHIYSKLKNISNNADYVDGNDYYWYITKDNYNKQISFEFEKTKTLNELSLIIMFCVILVIVIIISIILLNKNKKNNQL